MKGTICCEEKCTACMACANACPKNAIGIGVNKYGYEKVVINDDKSVIDLIIFTKSIKILFRLRKTIAGSGFCFFQS